MVELRDDDDDDGDYDDNDDDGDYGDDGDDGDGDSIQLHCRASHGERWPPRKNQVDSGASMGKK